MRFRPRIGDYVFISRGMTIATMTAITGFRPRIVGRKQCSALFTHRIRCHNHKFCTEFCPHVGDYFLSNRH